MSESVKVQEEEEEQPIIEDVPSPIKRDLLPQKDYYKKWDNYTVDELEHLDEEEKKAQEDSDRALGKDKAMYSDAHKKDKTTHLALKEAKKLWDRRREEEIQAKFELVDLVGETRTLLTAQDIDNKKVITLKNLTDCTIDLPSSLLGIIKVFIEKCVNCTVNVNCKLITSHLELSHCDSLTLNIEEEEIHTVQVDLCKTIRLKYGKGIFKSDHRVYSAGCLDFNMTALLENGGEYTSRNDYIEDLAPIVLYTGNSDNQDASRVLVGSGAKPTNGSKASDDSTTTAAAATSSSDGGENKEGELPSLVVGSVPNENGTATAEGQGKKNASQANFSDPRSEEQHFLTKLVPGKGLVTEVAIQVGSRWVTRSELDNETETQASITAREMQENTFRAEREKLSGNQAFGNAEYAQAAVHYTLAIDLASTADSQSTVFPQPVSSLIHVCYSNRAACFLKLGQHEKALADADSCIESAPDNFVKGHFRRGLALHAMGKYALALPSLGRALRLEDPKKKASLKQIQEAITFAERNLDMEMRKRMGH